MKKWIQSICQNSCKISWHWWICPRTVWLLAHNFLVDSSLNRPHRMSVSFFSFGTNGSIIGINILGTLLKVPRTLLLLAFVYTKILLQLFLHFSHLMLTESQIWKSFDQCNAWLQKLHYWWFLCNVYFTSIFCSTFSFAAFRSAAS